MIEKKQKEKVKMMTFRQMVDLNVSYKILSRVNATIENSKFGYACRIFINKNVKKVFEDYNNLIEMVRIEHALEDPITHAVILKKVVQEGERGYEYDRAGLKAVIQAEKALEVEWENKEFPVEPFICKDVPKLEAEQKEFFTGFVI